MALLELKGITAGYGQNVILRDFNLNVERGEFVSLLGSSGCGKTTTLRLIAGFSEPMQGTISFDGRDYTHVPLHKRNFGFVFQSYALFPHMTVFDNVAFGLKMRKLDKATIERDVMQMLKLVDLEGFENRYPREMSGGQRQRVALARAMVIKPDLMLFDEPLSNLDAKLRVKMRVEIRRIQQELGFTAIYVTHDQEECFAISDKVAIMNKGVIEQMDAPSTIYNSPNTEFIARFVGFENFFELTRMQSGGFAAADGTAIRVADQKPGERFKGCIRPEDVQVRPAGEKGPNAIPGEVMVSTFLGRHNQLNVKTAIGEFVVSADQTQVFPVGTAVTLVLSILTAMRGGKSFLWSWTAMLLAGFPAGVLIAYAKPFSTFAKKLYRVGAAVAGWQGARILSGEAGLIIEDADLFPPQNVTQGGMKLYGSRPAPMVIGYANAVVQTAGSGLVPLFEQMMHDQNGRRYTVDSFRRYESGGLGATIRGDVVLMGSIAFMKLMRVRVPEGTRLKQAVYLSVNGELTAVFALNYAPAESVRAGLASVLRAGALVPVLATRDFMITPQFLKQRYKIPPEHIEFPIVEERAALSEPETVRSGTQGALMARSSFASFAGSVVAARGLRSTAILCICIALVGSILGAGLMFVLTFLGADLAASCWNLFLYTALWLLPGLLAGLLAGRA